MYRLKEILAPIAEARMLAGTKAPDGMRTNETVGKIAGVSKELFRQFETVIESGDEEIVQQMAHVREWGGKFVVPIPEARVLD